jgi:hypothetical protein
MHLNPEDNEFLRDLFNTVRSLVEELNLQERGYRLVVNEGVLPGFSRAAFSFDRWRMNSIAVALIDVQDFICVVIAYIHGAIIF